MRRHSTGYLLGLGMFVAGLAYSAFCLELTVLNEHRITSSATSILESAPVQRTMADNIGTTLTNEIGSSPETLAAVQRAAVLALHDPRLQHAFTSTLEQAHRRLFEDPTQPVVLDSTEASAAIRDALRNVDANLAARVGENAQINVTIPADNLPDLRWFKRDDLAVARIGGLVALVLLALGLAIHSHPAWAVGKIGRWLFMIGFGELMVFFVIPHVLLAQFDNDAAQVASSVGGQITAVLVTRGLTLVLLGVTLIAGSVHFQRRTILRQRPPSPDLPAAPSHAVAPPHADPGVTEHELLPTKTYL